MRKLLVIQATIMSHHHQTLSQELRPFQLNLKGTSQAGINLTLGAKQSRRAGIYRGELGISPRSYSVMSHHVGTTRCRSYSYILGMMMLADRGCLINTLSYLLSFGWRAQEEFQGCDSMLALTGERRLTVFR